MKKLLFFGLILISTITFSQSPQFLNYQGVARDASGTVINSGNIGIRFEIWRTSPSGTKVYQEEMSSTPSAAGIFTTAIGSGSANIGAFNSINWANGPYFIVVGIDPTGGTSFSTVGTSQLLSVPYALYAETAGNAQTVNLSGPNVLGTYPNYTITAGATYSAGTGISISSGSIINTAPNQTVNISGPGVLGTYPSYTITAPGALTPSTGISIVGGTVTNTAPDQTVTISGATGTYPSFTVNPPPPATTITPGNSNITVSGAEPNFTISSVPSLSLVGAALSISNGNTVTLPTGTTYTNGAGITLTSGTIITNAAPNQTVFISGPNVIGSYPNYTVGAGSNPNIIGQGITSVTTAGNNYTVATLPVNMTYTPATGLLSYSPAIGPNTVNISPTLSFAGGILTAGSNTVLIPGTGLWSRPTTTATFLSNASDFVGIGVNSPAENLEVRSASVPRISIISGGGLGGGISFGTPANHFLGHIIYDVPLAKMSFWTNNVADQMVIDNNGNVGIGTNAPTERLQVQSGSNSDISIVATGANKATLNFGINTNHYLSGISYDAAANNMTFKSNSLADRLFFEFSGRNGMGTNAPVSELDVNGSLRLSGNRLFFGPVGGINSGYTGIYSDATGDLRFAVFQPGAPSNPPFASGGNSRDGMIIKNSNGFVGIGTNGPSSILHVKSSLAGGYIVNENTIGGSNPFGLQLISPTQTWYLMQGPGTGPADALAIYDGSASALRMVILPGNGNTGIGVNTPSAKLEVAGNVAINGPGSYRYLSPKTKYAKISAAELNSANPSVYQGRNDDGFSSGTVNGLNSMWATGGAAGAPAYFIAQIQLPDSAVITGLSAQVVKNGGALQSVVELWRSDGTGYLANTAQLIASCSTSFSGGAVQYPSAGSVSATFNVVDNASYVYFIRYIGEQNTQNLRFHLATITYKIYRSEY